MGQGFSDLTPVDREKRFWAGAAQGGGKDKEL
jgi:hypothetical protein